MKKKTIIKGTIILTVANLISRILGFINRIYLSNLIGAEGMGLYQLIFPIYMVCYTICCSGIFIAISKLTSHHLAKKQKGKAFKIIGLATGISFILSLILTGNLIIFSNYIASHIIYEPRIAKALRIVALSIPFCAISHSLKGYFYGASKPSVPAIAIVFEQIVRISIIYVLSSNFIEKGLEYAINMAIVAMVIGEIVSCIYVFIQYKLHTYKTQVSYRTDNKSPLKEIFGIAVPLTTNRLITTLLSSYETILIPTKLLAHGYVRNHALSIYGALTGMAMPLIFFPTVLTSSASLMLLGSISDAHARKEDALIQFTASKTIKYTIILGIVFTGFFYAFGHPLGLILYNDDYVGTLLVTLGFLCPFLYLVNTLSGILNGINQHMITFRNNIIGLTIRIIFIYSFIPLFGIKGYLYGLIISVLVVASLDIYFILKYVKLGFDVYNILIKPLLCVLSSCLVIDLLIKKEAIHMTSFTINYLVYFGLYFINLVVLLFITGTLTFEDFKKAL